MAASPTGQVTVLVTSMPSTAAIEGHQTQLRQIFQAKHISIEEVDGVDQGNREMRNKMFGISGKRAVYPQVFIKEGDDTLRFVGDFDEIQEMIESDGISADILAANPGIPTFKKAFEGYMP